jgi:hypothetical protein
MPEPIQELRSAKSKLRAYELIEAKILLLLSKGDRTHEALFAVLCPTKEVQYLVRCDPDRTNPQLVIYGVLGVLVDKGFIEPSKGQTPAIALIEELRTLVEP